MSSLLARQSRPIVNPPANGNALLNGFYMLHILGGHVAMPLLILLAVSRTNGARNIVFHNFCFTWILYSISFCLLLYVGQHKGPEPNWDLCAAQSSLVYGAPVLVNVALWSLVFQTWMDIRSPESTREAGKIAWRSVALIATPYIAALGFVIVPAISGSRQRGTITRSSAYFFCSSNMRELAITSAIAVGVICIIIIVFEVLILRAMKRYHVMLNTTSTRPWFANIFFVRIGIFTLYLLLNIVASGIAIFQPRSVVRIFIQASGPLIAFLVFGTSPDLYQCLQSPRPRKSYAS